MSLFSVKVQNLNSGITEGDIRELMTNVAREEDIVRIERISPEEVRVVFPRADLGEACEVLTGMPVGQNEFSTEVVIQREEPIAKEEDPVKDEEYEFVDNQISEPTVAIQKVPAKTEEKPKENTSEEIKNEDEPFPSLVLNKAASYQAQQEKKEEEEQDSSNIPFINLAKHVSTSPNPQPVPTNKTDESSLIELNKTHMGPEKLKSVSQDENSFPSTQESSQQNITRITETLDIIQTSTSVQEVRKVQEIHSSPERLKKSEQDIPNTDQITKEINKPEEIKEIQKEQPKKQVPVQPIQQSPVKEQQKESPIPQKSPQKPNKAEVQDISPAQPVVPMNPKLEIAVLASFLLYLILLFRN